MQNNLQMFFQTLYFKMQYGNRRNAPVMHRLPRPYDNWFDYYLFDMRVPESKFRKK